jgi:hypothetical protein
MADTFVYIPKVSTIKGLAAIGVQFQGKTAGWLWKKNSHF